MAKVNSARPPHLERGGNVTIEAKNAIAKIAADVFGLTRFLPPNELTDRRALTCQRSKTPRRWSQAQTAVRCSDLVRPRDSHDLKFSPANREWTPMRANHGVNALMASDSRLFAFIRGFRLNNHTALTFAEHLSDC
jgi:hypothetical protein